jgi:hypothetical protein
MQFFSAYQFNVRNKPAGRITGLLRSDTYVYDASNIRLGSSIEQVRTREENIVKFIPTIGSQELSPENLLTVVDDLYYTIKQYDIPEDSKTDILAKLLCRLMTNWLWKLSASKVSPFYMKTSDFDIDYIGAQITIDPKAILVDNDNFLMTWTTRILDSVLCCNLIDIWSKAVVFTSTSILRLRGRGTSSMAASKKKKFLAIPTSDYGPSSDVCHISVRAQGLSREDIVKASKEVATWMANRLQTNKYVSHQNALSQVVKGAGDEWKVSGGPLFMFLLPLYLAAGSPNERKLDIALMTFNGKKMGMSSKSPIGSEFRKVEMSQRIPFLFERYTELLSKYGGKRIPFHTLNSLSLYTFIQLAFIYYIIF